MLRPEGLSWSFMAWPRRSRWDRKCRYSACHESTSWQSLILLGSGFSLLLIVFA